METAPLRLIDGSSLEELATRIEPPRRKRAFVEKWRTPTDFRMGAVSLVATADGSTDAARALFRRGKLEGLDTAGKRTPRADLSALPISRTTRGPRGSFVIAGHLQSDVDLPTIRVHPPKEGVSYVGVVDSTGALAVQLLPVAGEVSALDVDTEGNVRVGVEVGAGDAERVSILEISGAEGVHAGGQARHLFDIDDHPDLVRATNGDWLAYSYAPELVRYSEAGTPVWRMKLPAPATRVLPGSDGGFYAIGGKTSEAQRSVFVLAFDRKGERRWLRTAGTSNCDWSCGELELEESAGAGGDALVFRVRIPTGKGETGDYRVDGFEGWPSMSLFALDVDGHTTWMAPFDPPMKCFVSPMTPISFDWVFAPAAAGGDVLFASFHCDSYRTGTCMYTADPSCRTDSDPDAALLGFVER